MVNKKKTIQIAILLIFILNFLMFSNASSFPDLPNDWSKEAIINAINNNLIRGIDGYIKPKSKLTRAQMVTIINRAFKNIEKADISDYEDLDVSDWYYEEFEKSVAAGLIEGYDKKMHPDDPIKREEAFTIMARALNLNNEVNTEEMRNTFYDWSDVSFWAKKSTANLIDNNYIHGYDNKLFPRDFITRAEFAKLIDNMVSYYLDTSDKINNKTIEGNILVKGQSSINNTKIKGDVIINLEDSEEKVFINNSDISGTIYLIDGYVDIDNVISNKFTVNNKYENILIIDNKNFITDKVILKSPAKLYGTGAYKEIYFDRLSLGSEISDNIIVEKYNLNPNAIYNIRTTRGDLIKNRSNVNIGEKMYENKIEDNIYRTLLNFDNRLILKPKDYTVNEFQRDFGDGNILNRIIEENPDIDYGFNGYNIKYWVRGKYVTKLELKLYYTSKIVNNNAENLNKYKIGKNEMIAKKESVDLKIEEFINNNINENMSDLEKEKAIHDFIIKNADYDVENGDKGIRDNHTSYGVLINGKGVCDSYAKAFFTLGKKSGLNVRYLRGLGINDNYAGPHAWNLIRLEDSWYNIDLTWNDPIYENSVNQPNIVSYDYFNLKDEDLIESHIRDESLVKNPIANGFKYHRNILRDKSIIE